MMTCWTNVCKSILFIHYRLIIFWSSHLVPARRRPYYHMNRLCDKRDPPFLRFIDMRLPQIHIGVIYTCIWNMRDA